MKLTRGEFIYGIIRRRWICRGDKYDDDETQVARGVESLPRNTTDRRGNNRSLTPLLEH